MTQTSAAPFHFESRRARLPAASAVDRIWCARGQVSYKEEKILPNGRAVLIFNLGDPFEVTCNTAAPQRLTTAWLCGPQTRFLVNRPLGRTHVVGATLHPLGAAALFKCPASEFTDRVIPLHNMWGAQVQALLQHLHAAASADARLDRLEAHLARALAETPSQDAMCTHALRRLCGRAPVRVHDLCRELGVSRKHLGQRMRAQGGLTPSTLSKITRFNRFLDALWAGPKPDFAQSADMCGYYDQPHMNRDFRDLSGVSPTQYMRRHKIEFDTEAGAEDNRLFVPGA